MAEENESTSEHKGWLNLQKFTPKKPSKVYIVEFLVMHVALLGVLSAGIGLFNRILDQTSNNSSSNLDVLALAGVNYTLLLVAYGLVSTILVVWLQARTNRSELAASELLHARRRRLLQYIFLSITSLILIGYIVAAVYSVLVVMFGSGDTAEPLWRMLVKDLFAVGFIGFVSYYVAHNVEPREETK